MPAAVHYREHHDGGVFNEVIDTKRKSMNKGSTCVSVHHWIPERSFRNGGECNQNLVEELVTKP